MTELWSILLPTPDDWLAKGTASVDHVGSVYLPHGATTPEVIASASLSA